MNQPAPPLPSPTPAETGNGLSGLRVCAFESRKGAELRALIERMGGTATIAPSMREIPLTDNPLALEFGERLLSGGIDIVVFLTGVGARALADVLQTRYALSDVISALNQRVVVVRGPKPAVVLREWKVKIDVQVPEPNTWRDLLRVVEQAIPLAGKQIAVQEYGIPNEELYAGLRALGGTVLPVPVYRWELPLDTSPLRNAVRSTIAGDFDLLMFTSAQQLRNVLQIADEEGGREAWLAAARRCVVVSIGPTATETLVAEGLPPDIEPEHPKMGHMVVAAGKQAPALLNVAKNRVV